jgi:hypothetical protein
MMVYAAGIVLIVIFVISRLVDLKGKQWKAEKLCGITMESDESGSRKV